MGGAQNGSVEQGGIGHGGGAATAGALAAPGAAGLEQLREVARRMRRHILTMTAAAQSGHPGGSLSAVELVAALYFHVLRYRPQDPVWPDRDRFILSKGHATPLLYAALAEAGYLPVEELATFRTLGSRLQGHPDRRSTPGVEMSAGSLGMGLSYGLGTALAGRLDKKDYRVFVLLGDGENEEGQVWEAALAGAHFALDKVTAVIDHNKIQNDGFVADILQVAPLAPKWAAFGWRTIEIDGHDLAQVTAAYAEAGETKGRPTAIIAHTVKGKGVSFMENNPAFHGKAASPAELAQALAEIG